MGQLGVVGEAAPHHVGAVVGAGADGGQSLASGAGRHPGQRLHALRPGRDLEDPGQQLPALVQRLGEGPGGHEAPAQLQAQLLGHVAEWLELLHVLADALQIPASDWT